MPSLLLAAAAMCGALAPGVTCSLPAAEEAALTLDLQPGDLLHVEVEALGANLALSLRAPEGTLLHEVDELPAIEASEELYALAPAGGPFVLVLRSLTPRPGSARVVALERRPATAEDRARVAAVHRALELRAVLDGRDAAARHAAVEPAQEVARQLEELGLAERSAGLRRWVARALQRDGDTGGGRAMLQEVVEQAERLGAQRLLAAALNDLTRDAKNAGRYAEGVELGRRAIAAADRSGYTRLRAQARLNFGTVADRVGLADEALAAYDESIRLHERADLPEEAAACRFNVGAILYHRGDVDGARAAFEEARSYFEPRGDAVALRLVYSNLAASETYLGRPERAVELLEQALALPADERDTRQRYRIAALMNLGQALVLLGCLDDAERRYREAEALARAADLTDRLSTALQNLADLRVEQGRADEASTLLDESVELARRSADRERLADALRAAGAQELRRGRLVEARLRLTEALALAEADGLRRVELRTRHRLAELARDEGRPAVALGELRRALDLAERLRSSLAVELDRATFLDSVRPLYELEVELQLELARREPGAGHEAAAFAASERGRARLLLELLDPLRFPRPSPEARELRGRAADLRAAQQRLLASGGAQPEARAEAESAVARAAAALEEARARLARARPREAARLDGRATADLAATQAFLGPDTALLEYVVAERFAVLFVVRHDRLSVHRLASPGQINAAVERLTSLLEQPSRLGAALFRARAAEAYDLLVRPAAGDLAGASTLLVSPDGRLQRLPFGVLVENGARGSSYRDLAYLARRVALARVPSASAALELVRRPAADRRGQPALVAFGDPVLPGASARPSVLRSVFELGAGTLAPLPGAADEARRLARLVPGSRALVGTEASEERVKTLAAVRTARLLHFAAHGLASERRPELSSLVLAPSAGEDGLLQAWEIVDLGLSADLVVLSACRSALGRELSGEGFLGLTQAFLEAGAGGVVASLWPVADRSTADLMASFYGRLARGAEPAAALAEAQRELLARGGLDAHPARWAPFVLVGGGAHPTTVEPRHAAAAR